MIQLDAFDATRLKTAREIVHELGSVLVAYSGGVDSTLLLKLSMDELCEGAVAVLASSRAYPESEQEEAPALARSTGARLVRLQSAEAALKSLGFHQVRVRHHDDVARIEVDAAEIPRLIAERERVAAAVREAGYKFVSADLEGYSTGSLNRTWKPETSAKSS